MRWNLLLCRGAHANDTRETWAKRLVNLIQLLRPSRPWTATDETGTLISASPAKDMPRVIAAGQGGSSGKPGDEDWPWDKHRHSVNLASNLDNGKLDLAVWGDFIVGKPPPYGHFMDNLWTYSEVTCSFSTDGATADENAVLPAAIQAIRAIEPQWAFLRADMERTLWNIGMSGGMEHGYPQVGWLTYLQAGQYTNQLSKVTDARRHPIGQQGTLIEIAQRPWSLLSRPSALAYVKLRTELLAADAIHAPVDAARDLQASWQKHGIHSHSLVPDDAQSDGLVPRVGPPPPNPPSQTLDFE